MEITKEYAQITEKVDTVNAGLSKTNAEVKVTNTGMIELLKFREKIDDVLIYIAYALYGTGVVALFDLLMDVSLDVAFYISVPIFFFISDLLVAALRNKDIINFVARKNTAIIAKAHNLESFARTCFEIFICALFQEFFTYMGVYFIPKLFETKVNNGNYPFWILSLSVSCIMVQWLRVTRKNKERTKKYQKEAYEMARTRIVDKYKMRESIRHLTEKDL